MSWQRSARISGLILGLAAEVSVPAAAVLHAISVDGILAEWNDVLADPIQTSYDAASAVGAGTTIGFSHDGGLTFDASQSAPVTHVRWARSSGLAPGAAGSVSFQVDVP